MANSIQDAGSGAVIDAGETETDSGIELASPERPKIKVINVPEEPSEHFAIAT